MSADWCPFICSSIINREYVLLIIDKPCGRLVMENNRWNSRTLTRCWDESCLKLIYRWLLLKGDIIWQVFILV